MRPKLSIILLSALFILAGINHFINPGFYLKIMPAYIPIHNTLIIFSGIVEIILGCLFLLNKTRKLAAFLIILMLLTFLPVHIEMIIRSYPSLSLAWLRMGLQFCLIFWIFRIRNTKLNYS